MKPPENILRLGAVMAASLSGELATAPVDSFTHLEAAIAERKRILACGNTYIAIVYFRPAGWQFAVRFLWGGKPKQWDFAPEPGREYTAEEIRAMFARVDWEKIGQVTAEGEEILHAQCVDNVST